MVQIRKRRGEIIIQDGGGLVEIDPMFLKIARSFFRIPLENHTCKYILNKFSHASFYW